ncbi:MAG: hypothetical protein AAGI92_00095 [Pseudomonadota bacterium]
MPTAVISATASLAVADETEVILRKTLPFEECERTISNMLTQLNANSAFVQITHDTAATFRVKLQSQSANLIFSCNGVAAQIEVARQTPGDLQEVSGN